MWPDGAIDVSECWTAPSQRFERKTPGASLHTGPTTLYFVDSSMSLHIRKLTSLWPLLISKGQRIREVFTIKVKIRG